MTATDGMSLDGLNTIRVRRAGHVLYATLDAPPMNLVGGPLVTDMVALFKWLPTSDVRVVVFDSADPDFFLARADIHDVPAYTAAAATWGAAEDQWFGTFLRGISDSPVISIAKIAGRVGGNGSEFALACDMRFASRERASFGQPEVGTGMTPGSGAMQHLTRLMGRGRAMEVILGADDWNAEMAERYGWINRALPDAELDDFVTKLAERIAAFPDWALQAAKQRINAIALPDIEQVRHDALLFQQIVRSPESKQRISDLGPLGFGTDRNTEIHLGEAIAALPPS